MLSPSTHALFVLQSRPPLDFPWAFRAFLWTLVGVTSSTLRLSLQLFAKPCIKSLVFPTFRFTLLAKRSFVPPLIAAGTGTALARFQSTPSRV
jgi:hypothetical protein